MAKKARIPTPKSPITGKGPIPGSEGYDPWGYAALPHKGHHKFFNKMLTNAPAFLGDTSMYSTAIGNINDILSRHGQLPPEILQRSQAAIEAQRQNAQRGLAQRQALSGAAPGSMQESVVSAGIDQAGDRAQQDERFNQAQAAEQRGREDLNLVIPWMQMLMGYTQPKGRNSQVTPAPVGNAPHTDWAGIGAGLASSALNAGASAGWFKPSQAPPPPTQDYWGTNSGVGTGPA